MSPPGLASVDLTVRYGGQTAVDAVSLTAPPGRVTGLIGPNGAGKTSFFGACSGLIRPAGGFIRFFGADITRKSPAYRARHGLGRTFQRTEIVNAMTVETNVLLGAECRIVGSNPLRQLITSPRQRRMIQDAAYDALHICELTTLAGRIAGTLSTGQRRMVELARVLAGGFSILLLDEPSSGLDRAETDRFGEILTAVVSDRRIGVLLVEHDIDLVMTVCSHLYVLEFGRLIFEGTPNEAQASRLVRDAYLGQTPGAA